MTPAEQYALHMRLLRLRDTGWTIQPDHNRWRIGYPEYVREAAGLADGASIRIGSPNLDAAVAAAEAVEDFSVLLNATGRL